MRGHATGLDYHRMLLDDVHRVVTYERALRRLVRPGDVVLDVGTGTGLLAMLAARQGARVHAVESMPVADVARALIAANGLADRVTVHQADLVELAPVEPVDLVVSDFMGRFLVDDGMLEAMEAAGRWLKPGGRCCPAQVRLLLAPVGDFEVPMVDRFREPLFGLDLSAALPLALETCYAAQLGPRELLASPALFHDLRPPAPPAPFDRELAFVVERPGELRALAGWFDATLAGDVVLSTAPGVVTHWGQYLFPLEPVAVKEGSRIEVRLWLDRDDWRWEGAVDGRPFSHRSRQDPSTLPVRPAPAPLTGRARVQELTRQGADAFAAGDLQAAHRLFREVVTALDEATGDLEAIAFENLGVSALHTGRPRAAAVALLRALDGDPVAREQSARLLLVALERLGHRDELPELQDAYNKAFRGYDEPPS